MSHQRPAMRRNDPPIRVSNWGLGSRARHIKDLGVRQAVGVGQLPSSSFFWKRGFRHLEVQLLAPFGVKQIDPLHVHRPTRQSLER